MQVVRPAALTRRLTNTSIPSVASCLHRRRFSTRQHSQPPPIIDFYDRTISELAEQPIKRLTVSDLHRYGSHVSEHRVKNSAKFLRSDLPVRLAKRVQHFFELPFNVCMNPSFNQVLEMYAEAFYQLHSFRKIETLKDAEDFTAVLSQYVDNHSNVPNMLAVGCKECLPIIEHRSRKQLITFMQETIKSRIGIRLLIEQQLAIRHAATPDRVGLFDLAVDPIEMLSSAAEVAADACRSRYGCAPEIAVGGRPEPFAYISPHLKYIFAEILKNSFRASCEHHGPSAELPPVVIDVVRSNDTIIFRIRDEGGGISDEILPHVFDYTFTTADKQPPAGVGGTFGAFCEPLAPSTAAGYGVGLPMARDYAQYFGGSLRIETVPGLGTDTYVRLKNLDQYCMSHIR